jgi:multiple antibiotic resistance protein
MDHSLVARIATEFLIGFSALFSLINPLGMAFVFAEKTRSLPEGMRVELARKVATYSFALILAAMLLGAPFLIFFGISLPALRIAGGLLVAFAGYGMLTTPDGRNDEEVTPVTAATAEAMTFFPLTMPLTVGPGTIAASIALGAQDKSGLIGHLVIWAVALPIAVSIYICYRHAATVAKAIGPEATRIVTRLTAFLLMCIGVQMVLTGATAWLGTLIRNGSL